MSKFSIAWSIIWTLAWGGAGFVCFWYAYARPEHWLLWCGAGAGCSAHSHTIIDGLTERIEKSRGVRS